MLVKIAVWWYLVFMNVFVRRDGVFGGVCGGLAHVTGLPVVVLRLLMIGSMILSAGLTVLLYIAAVLAFPNPLSLALGDRPQFLGVCHHFSKKIGIHESWLRFFALVGFVLTAFAPVFAVYMIMFIVMNVTTEPVHTEPSDSSVRDVN